MDQGRKIVEIADAIVTAHKLMAGTPREDK
jgi:hypothetical protein